jgi:hypothetical protein
MTCDFEMIRASILREAQAYSMLQLTSFCACGVLAAYDLSSLIFEIHAYKLSIKHYVLFLKANMTFNYDTLHGRIVISTIFGSCSLVFVDRYSIDQPQSRVEPICGDNDLCFPIYNGCLCSPSIPVLAFIGSL